MTSPITTTIEYKGELYDAYQWSLDIPQDKVEEKFEDYFKENYDKKPKGGGLFGGEEIEVEAVALTGYDKPINLFTRIYTIGEQEKKTELIWWTLNNDKTDAYNPSLKEEMERYVASFAPIYYTELKQNIIKDISDVDKEIDDLNSEIAKSDSKLAKVDSRMAKLEEKMNDLKAKMKDQETDKRALINEKQEVEKERTKFRSKKETLSSRLDKVNRNLR